MSGRCYGLRVVGGDSAEIEGKVVVVGPKCAALLAAVLESGGSVPCEGTPAVRRQVLRLNRKLIAVACAARLAVESGLILLL